MTTEHIEGEDSDYTPSRADGIEVSDLRDGVVLYDPRTRTAHHLNTVATLVWELVGERTVSEVEAVLGQVLEVDDETARVYTAEALAQLRASAVIS